MNILEINSVSKFYREVTAVNDVSLNIPKNSIFGLLGPNGAGKTSLIRMITQITGLDKGQILFDGEQLRPEHTAMIGYMPEERGLYKKMKIGDQLMYLAQLKDLSKKEAKETIESWLSRFEIEHWWNKKVEDLSKGMQQKVQFISTVMHNPKLLILDEPFSGLDPINATLIREEIFRLVKEDGISVIFSTHRMEQVEEICEHIALIDQGKCILEGPVGSLKQQFKKNEYEVVTSSDLNQFSEKYKIESLQDGKSLFHLDEAQNSTELLKDLVAAEIQVNHFSEVLPSMNEIFIEQVQTYQG